ncbi:hypothetical protein EC973_008707 [Apophysomyces ossiformis]|uniref:DUF221-domain-containing protein n=1 Tax=Apophysomyces ossiformis TaxID=679940 RepID=A0A8H7BQ28_9FUNG|nr:hypothetical protein EC973_008707 [Apophysomyces ossiformis]
MAVQLGINLAIAIGVILCFSFLRPRHTLVYAPKYKFSSEEKRPPIVGSGWFDWVRPLLTVSDEFLIERIGFDAVMFIRFVRVLRKLLLIMSVIGIFALIPINIVATARTGNLPTGPSIDFLSISSINYLNGKMRPDPDTRWYWSPFAATWLFSIIIAYYMYRSSCDYVNMRQQYFRHPAKRASANSLLISNVPEDKRSDEKLKQWLETKSLPYPIQEAMIGHHSDQLTKLTKEHEEAVRNLEDTLSYYLNDGKSVKAKRPTVRVGGFLGIGGKKKDAIDYYTEKVNETEEEINKLRRTNTKTTNYGWVSFERIEWAHKTNRALARQINVQLSPTPQDLIWSNLPLSNKARQAKRWMGRGLYWVFVFAWMIPVGALSATSNLMNLIRFIPDGDVFIDNHQFLMGFMQSYFTPIVMAVFFLVLPYIFRFLSQMQGYRSETTLDRKVLLKLYAFFIINNFLLFTLASILLSLYGQIQALILNGTLPNDEKISDYVMQLAKNISDVSNFWINYVCIKGLGITMDLAQIMPLLMITLKKLITRPSPRKLREMAQPTVFDYPQNYNLLLFFFTISLVYSAIAPLVLPFALLYFAVATMVYKYLLMYINVTKIESGGKMWPVLFQTVMSSVVLFQVIMIVVLNLKGGSLQSYLLIPLPFFTLAYQYFYARRLHVLGSFLIGSGDNLPPLPKKSKDDLFHKFRDPALHGKLSTPMVHDDVKHLLSKVYHQKQNQEDQQKQHKQNKQQHSRQHHNIPGTEVIEMAQQFGKKLRDELDLKEDNGFCHGPDQRRMTVLGLDNGQQLKFCSVTEKEVEEPDKEANREEDEEEKEEIMDNDKQKQPHQLLLRRQTTQSDFDDDQRGLVQDNHVEKYWQQNHDGYVSSPSIDHSGFATALGPSSTILEQDETRVSRSLTPIPQQRQSRLQLPENGTQDDSLLLSVLGASALAAGSGEATNNHLRAPGQERNVTSEYIEMYESWPTQQRNSSDDLGSHEVESKQHAIRPLSLDEFGDTPMKRRQSAPLLREYAMAKTLMTVADQGEQVLALTSHRRQSMPSGLASQPEETNALDHLKRRLSAPSFKAYEQHATRSVNRSSLEPIVDTNVTLQRSRTMPVHRRREASSQFVSKQQEDLEDIVQETNGTAQGKAFQSMLRRNSWTEKTINPFSDEYGEFEDEEQEMGSGGGNGEGRVGGSSGRRKSGSSNHSRLRRSQTLPSGNERLSSQDYRITYYENALNESFESPSLLDLPRQRLSSSSSLEYFRRQYQNTQQDRIPAQIQGQRRP